MPEVSNTTKGTYASLLFIPHIMKWVELKLDADSSITKGEFLYIFGKKLSNNQILPRYFMREFDLSIFKSSLDKLSFKVGIYTTLCGAAAVILIVKAFFIAKKTILRN